jgi:hypothetical protein
LTAYGYANGNLFTTKLPIHITGYGTYNLQSIETDDDPLSGELAKKKEPAMKLVEIADLAKQESLIIENTPSPFASEQTWPSKEEIKDPPKVPTKVKMQTIEEKPGKEEGMVDSESGEENQSESESDSFGPEHEEKLEMKDEENPGSDHSESEEEDQKDLEQEKISAKYNSEII